MLTVSVLLLGVLHIFPHLIHTVILWGRQYLPILQIRKLELRSIVLGGCGGASRG